MNNFLFAVFCHRQRRPQYLKSQQKFPVMRKQADAATKKEWKHINFPVHFLLN